MWGAMPPNDRSYIFVKKKIILNRKIFVQNFFNQSLKFSYYSFSDVQIFVFTLYLLYMGGATPTIAS